MAHGGAGAANRAGVHFQGVGRCALRFRPVQRVHQVRHVVRLLCLARPEDRYERPATRQGHCSRHLTKAGYSPRTLLKASS